MARKTQSAEVSKSDHVRNLLHQNPHVTVTEATEALRKMGIDLKPSLFYFVKGKLSGRKGRRRQIRRNVATVMANGAAPTSAGSADVLATIRKVKAVATEVGGLKKLAALVEALAE
jgi:hypothetical protein